MSLLQLRIRIFPCPRTSLWIYSTAGATMCSASKKLAGCCLGRRHGGYPRRCVVGDVARGCSERFCFSRLASRQKILMKGNHDYWWNTARKMENFFKEKGFETLSIVHNSAMLVGNISVCGTRGWFFDAEEDADKKVLLREAGRLRTSIESGIALGGEPVVFLHYPPITQDRICPEIYDVLVEYKIKRCFYGHLHSFATKSAFEGERDGIKFSLISGDHLEFLPKLIEKQP